MCNQGPLTNYGTLAPNVHGLGKSFKIQKGMYLLIKLIQKKKRERLRLMKKMVFLFMGLDINIKSQGSKHGIPTWTTLNHKQQNRKKSIWWVRKSTVKQRWDGKIILLAIDDDARGLGWKCGSLGKYNYNNFPNKNAFDFWAFFLFYIDHLCSDQLYWPFIEYWLIDNHLWRPSVEKVRVQ